MRLIDALATLSAMRAPVFDTGDAAAHLGVDTAHASTVLARLAVTRHVVRLRRGVWAFRDRVDPLALPEYLTSPFPSYVSLQSALYLRGMIDQVPAVTYAVSLARTRRYTTPLGTVSIHHVDPGFFFGFEHAGASGGRLATPEKALVDLLYLAPARSKLFRALPELDIPASFSARRARAIVARIGSVRRRTMVARALDAIIIGSRARIPHGR
ncbi:MAG: type IV toxin-antitoxin system AbiEi family antitoxin domain-containing protein [Acidobacteria bacterium]|nr:type IV toxin-antitoxin system AbiEi family antitoxin domain-containing protein [Acidobacteriota bacterium]